MDARTVTAFDVTTAFAVPDPGAILANASVFSGPEALPITRPGQSLSLLRVSNDLFSLSLSTVDVRDTNRTFTNVNTQEWCNHRFFVV